MVWQPRAIWSSRRALYPRIRFWEKRQSRVVVLMYHEVLGDREAIESWTVVREHDFAQQMEYLKGHFRVIRLEEALNRMEAGEDFTEDLAVVTFDDGYAGNRKVMLPIIESMEIPVTVFVSTAAVQDQTPYWWDSLIVALQPGDSDDMEIDLETVGLRKYQFRRREQGEKRWTGIQELLTDLKKLSPQSREAAVSGILHQLDRPGGPAIRSLRALTVGELKEMAASRLVTIGAHSHDHDILVQLSEDGVRNSIGRSKTLLEEWTGKRVSHFAYPNGDYNDAVIRVLKDSGFECGVATIPRAWNKSDSVFSIPRVGIGRYDSMTSFKAMLAGA